jgi:hypothetical protein
MSALDGNGTSIVFATSAFAANIISVDGPSVSRESIDCTHLGTTKSMEFFPANLGDAGELSLEIEFDPDIAPPIADNASANDVAETITITWPLPAGQSTAATWAFSGFATSYSGGATSGERMTGSLTVKISGSITVTPSA